MKKTGRNSKYDESFPGIALAKCRKGATDEDLAEVFGVCVATINNWKNEHLEFLDALKNGKDRAVAEVENALFKSATGHYYEEDAIIRVNKDKQEVVKITKYVYPMINAQIFYLKNRASKELHDRKEVDIDGDIGFTAVIMRVMEEMEASGELPGKDSNLLENKG